MISMGIPLDTYSREDPPDKRYRIKFNLKTYDMLDAAHFLFWEAFLPGANYEEAREDAVKNMGFSKRLFEKTMAFLVGLGLIVKADENFQNVLMASIAKSGNEPVGLTPVEAQALEFVDGEISALEIWGSLPEETMDDDLIRIILQLAEKKQIYFSFLPIARRY